MVITAMMTFEQYRRLVSSWLASITSSDLIRLKKADYNHQISRYTAVKNQIRGLQKCMVVDRIVPVNYPVDYGMSVILTELKPATKKGDGDDYEWADVILVDHGDLNFREGHEYEVFIVGRIEMLDCGQRDDKYLAIPVVVVKNYERLNLSDTRWKTRVMANLLMYYAFLTSYKQEYPLSLNQSVKNADAIEVTGLYLQG